jgi:pyrroloquinoline-quinone synthase
MAAGELTRDDLREYGSIYFHQISSFPTYLSALHSRLPDGEVRRAVLQKLCSEELEGRPHSELWLDFAEGMGGNREEIKSREPIPEFRRLGRTFRLLLESTASGLAAFYAYESQVPWIAEKEVRALRRAYGADERSCYYFDLHRTADLHQSKVWLEQLTQVVRVEPGWLPEAVLGAECAAEALWHALDGVERVRHEHSLQISR